MESDLTRCSNYTRRGCMGLASNSCAMSIALISCQILVIDMITIEFESNSRPHLFRIDALREKQRSKISARVPGQREFETLNNEQ